MQNYFNYQNYQGLDHSIPKVSLRKKISHPDKNTTIKYMANNREQSVPTASSIKSQITYSIDESRSKFTARQTYANSAHKQDLSERSRVVSKSKISLKSVGKQTGYKVRQPSIITTNPSVAVLKLNLKYSDIVLKKKKNYMLELTRRLCSTNQSTKRYEQSSYLKGGLLDAFACKYQTNKFGCKCEIKCLVVERWLAQHGSSIPKHKTLQKEKYSSYVVQIQKDLPRTQPFEITFQQDFYLKKLKETLVSYVLIDPQVGYSQGMNFIASVFVYHASDLTSCIKLMDIFFWKNDYRSIFANNFAGCRQHAQNIIKVLNQKCSDIYSFLIERHEIDLKIFIQGWLISLLANVIPLEHMHMVIDLFLNQSFKGVYKLICSLFMYMYEIKTMYLLQNQADIMQNLSFQSLLNSGIDWEELIISSHNFPLNSNDLNRISASNS